MDDSNFMIQGQDSVKKNAEEQSYEKYLLIKIKGQKPVLYLSGNTEISTLDKIKF